MLAIWGGISSRVPSRPDVRLYLHSSIWLARVVAATEATGKRLPEVLAGRTVTYVLSRCVPSLALNGNGCLELARGCVALMLQ